MKKFERDYLIQSTGRKIFVPIAIIQMGGIVAFLTSPFLLLWMDWSFVWRFGLTGIMAVLFCYGLDKAFRSKIGDKVDEMLDEIKAYDDTTKSPMKKSKFQERVEEMQRRQKEIMENK